MDNVIKIFLESGLLGAVCLTALWFAFRKDRQTSLVGEEKDELHKAHAIRLETLVSEHKAEMMSLEERYITKAETWMQKYYDLAATQSEVLTSLERRYEKDNHGHSST